MHDISGLPAADGLRLRRFAEQARDEFLATGTDFTQDSKTVASGRDAWANVYYQWRQRARQSREDPETFEYYSADTHSGAFIPSAQWAADMRAAHASGDTEAVWQLIKTRKPLGHQTKIST